MKIVMLQSWWGVRSSWMKFQDSGPATEIKGFSLKGNGCNKRNSVKKQQLLWYMCLHERTEPQVCIWPTICGCELWAMWANDVCYGLHVAGLQLLQVSSRSPVNMDSRVALQIGRPPSKSKRWVFGNPTRTSIWYGTNLIDICWYGTSTAQRDWMWILLI